MLFALWQDGETATCANWVLPSLFLQDLIPLCSKSTGAHATVWWASELSQTKVNPAAKGWLLAQKGSLSSVSLHSHGCQCWHKGSVGPSSGWRQLFLTLWTCALACSHQEPVMHLSLEAQTRPFAHSALAAHPGLSRASESSTFPAELDYSTYLSTHVDSCYKAQVFMYCCGMCFDLLPKWDSITHSLLSAFEITTVTSFCKYVLHQQKKFLNRPAECIAHAFIYRYVQHQWAEKSILFSISLLVTKFPSWNWPLLLHSCNTDHL